MAVAVQGKKRLFLIGIAVTLVAAIISLILASILMQQKTSAPNTDYEMTSIVMGGHVFTARTPMTEDAQVLGLSGTESLTDSQAMLFVFEYNQRWGIWMKDMKIPIDIVWLNAEKKIIHVEKNAQPDSYPTVFRPDQDARYVIETATGRSDDLGVELGDSVQFTDPKRGNS